MWKCHIHLFQNCSLILKMLTVLFVHSSTRLLLKFFGCLRYFIATNATSTFHSIVSNYPGEVILVSIQCPNPDFNKPEHRWRMLQKSLVEAVADLLIPSGKVFLQSDIKAVAVRMKEQFLRYGKGKLSILQAQDTSTNGGWLEENPFGIRSDWEQHVLDRGAPMYRLMLLKSNNVQ